MCIAAWPTFTLQVAASSTARDQPVSSHRPYSAPVTVAPPVPAEADAPIIIAPPPNAAVRLCTWHKRARAYQHLTLPSGRFARDPDASVRLPKATTVAVSLLPFALLLAQPPPPSPRLPNERLPSQPPRASSTTARCHPQPPAPMGSSSAGSALGQGLGFAGGLLLALCLVPELWHVYRNRCADDLSWAWMVLYTGGLALSTAYLIMVDALAAWTPMVVEIAMVSTIHTCAGRRCCCLDLPYARLHMCVCVHACVHAPWCAACMRAGLVPYACLRPPKLAGRTHGYSA